MKELISNLRKKIISEIKGSVDKNSLEELKIKYLGKKGEFKEYGKCFKRRKT